MRVLQLGFIPLEKGGDSAGGIATHVWELSRALCHEGHQVEVFALNRRDPDLAGDGIRVHHFPAGAEALSYPFRQAPRPAIFRAGSAPGGSWLKGLGKAYWVDRVLRKSEPDIIHSHLPSFFFVPVARALGWQGPVVLTIHSVHDLTHNPSADPRNLERVKALFQANLLLSDALITVHLHVMEEAARLGLRWQAPVRTVINAVDASGFSVMPRERARQELGLAPGGRLILFSGIMTGRKGEQELISAMPLMKSEASLLMLGYGPAEAEARALIQKLGLGGRVSVPGPVARDRMVYYYNAADLFALPSHSEGFALSYMESALCGTPYLADKGIPEELRSGVVSVLVDSRDPADIARGLDQALAREWDREAIAGFGAGFAWGPGKVREYLEVYELASDRARSRRDHP